ncbi:MAG: hypothetical protein IT539_00475 [Bradyrhizobiaceae bacterium]|nr:hypothetical protein [Bradyrhizobiaceae bacterium]
MRSSILIGAACAALSATCASADIRITNDPGGIIDQHVQRFAGLRDSGERVIIDGRCMSSCTLVLGMLPPDRVCVTRRAVLGFHAAWVPGANGQPIRSESGTSAMWSIYPAHIRRWIANNGGLTPKMLMLRGSELTSMVRTCR